MLRYFTLFFFLSIGISSQTFLLSDKNVAKGQTHNLWTIQFALGSAHLIENGCKPTLDSVLQFLLDNPNVKAEIGSHSDSRGDAKKNCILSQARAGELKKYLISRGIEVSRLVSKGYGNTKQIYTQEYIKNHSNKCEPGLGPIIANRRITLIILNN